jgi:hypothetical protein
MGHVKNVYITVVENVKERHHLEDLEADASIVLQLKILRGDWIWTRF